MRSPAMVYGTLPLAGSCVPVPIDEASALASNRSARRRAAASVRPRSCRSNHASVRYDATRWPLLEAAMKVSVNSLCVEPRRT